MPSQMPNSLMRCPCGKVFDSHRLDNTVIHVPHITAAEAKAADIQLKNGVFRDTRLVAEIR